LIILSGLSGYEAKSQGLLDSASVCSEDPLTDTFPVEPADDLE